MTPEIIRKILNQVASGKTNPQEAFKELSSFHFEDLGFAKVDHHRGMRGGFPEVILCQGKTNAQVGKIAERIVKKKCPLLATRATPLAFQEVKKRVPKASYNKDARVIYHVPKSGLPKPKTLGPIAVICAGTSDIPVAEEAALTAEMMGNKVIRAFDAGVAGIHRLFSHMEDLRKATVLVVAAGMEGALPSVVGGLVSRPVIAVPTSVGYGASFGGIAALLGMLNSCASGVTVVNIDNGFGAGYAASLMNRHPNKEQ